MKTKSRKKREGGGEVIPEKIYNSEARESFKNSDSTYERTECCKMLTIRKQASTYKFQ
jgi:hypothetical protein